MQELDIQDLLKRYTRGQCTPEEEALVETTYLNYLPEVAELTDEDIEQDLKWILAGLPKDEKKEFRLKILRFAAAAAILITVSITLLYFGRPSEKAKVALVVPKVEKIVPGTDRAILTLSDGRKIILDKNASVLFSDSTAGIKVRKTVKGELIYEVMTASSDNQEINAFNTIETPKGSQYKVVLPDGTNVWVNAGSTLRYPLVFREKRSVSLTGEAYFEVARNKNMPFVVSSGGQQVEVLGTHFNINAYSDEPGIKTTLLQGRVLVTKGKERAIMNPGQEVVNIKNSSTLNTANVDDASESIAWKNGVFLFKHENYYAIMKKLSRWYDIDVEYRGDFSHQYFSGSISKFEEVAEVLKTMELTHAVKFKIVGRRIVVMK